MVLKNQVSKPVKRKMVAANRKHIKNSWCIFMELMDKDEKRKCHIAKKIV